MSEHTDLRQKIGQAKQRLPMPDLLSRLGLSEHAKKTARCPFPGHEDKHPSFSVFKGEDGFWHWKCFSKCGDGDEITFLSKLKGLLRTQAMSLYLEMAGFPASSPPKSHEYPKCLGSRAFPESPEYPVSEGQGIDTELEKELKTLAGQNACTQFNTARPRRFKLLRDLTGLQKQIKRKLNAAELETAFNEWHQLSLKFLDPAKTHDCYEAKFLSEFGKVRFGTGEGRLATALENVARLSPDQLPIIPKKPNAPETWRRLTALHRELARLRAKPKYFLSYRDAAKVFDGMTHQQAFDITGALCMLGVIEIADKGKAGLKSQKAAEFRNLWAQRGNERGGNCCLNGGDATSTRVTRAREGA